MKAIIRFFLLLMIGILSSGILYSQIKISGPGTKEINAPRAYHTLWEQLDVGSQGRPSQNFDNSFPGYTCQAADDFIVGTGETWEIESVYVLGSNSGTAFNLADLYIYPDENNMPDDTALITMTGIACTDINGNLTINLSQAISLDEGHYWISVRVANDYNTYGQWFWTYNNEVIENEAVWQNPLDGFGLGATSWTINSTVFGDYNDYAFALYGEAFVEVGSGTYGTSYPTYYWPYYNYYKSNKSQQLYLASELQGAKVITDIAFDFERYTPASDENLLPDFEIKIIPTSVTEFDDNSQWEDESGGTVVFTHDNFAPASDTGWQIIDIDDYDYTGTSNLIVQVSWGQMPGYCSFSNFYRNYKSISASSEDRSKYRYSDSPPPLDNPSAREYYSNMRFYFEPFDPPGSLDGYVSNCDGLPIWEAIVYSVDLPQFRDTTDNAGYYIINGIYAGEHTFASYKTGFYPDTVDLTIPPADTLSHNWTLTNPEMSVSPLLYDVMVNPNEYYETVLSILNTGCGILEWMVEVVYQSDEEQFVPFRKVGKSGADKNADTDPDGTSRNLQSGRDLFDLQFVFDAETPAGSDQLAGSECDAEYIYATNWAGNQIYKYELDGTYIGLFTISGVSGLRDLAFDGNYMYGGAAGTIIWEMDFENQSLISSITSPVDVRAIAYDEGSDGFWVNNWDSDLTLVSRSGATMNSIAGPPSLYGLAYDKWSSGGPFLWLFTGTVTGGGCQVEQMEISSGNLTGVSHTVSDDITGAIAGGLWTSPGFETGLITLGGCAQASPDQIFGYELAPGGGGPTGWLTFDEYEGVVQPNGGTNNAGVNFSAEDMEAGTIVQANIVLSTFPNVGTVTIPATMTVAGDALGSIETFTAEIINQVTGKVSLDWSAVTRDVTFLHYLIRRDNELIGTTTFTSYIDFLPDYGTYCYEVQAVYEEGNSVPAGPECVEWYIPSILVDPLALSDTVWEGEMVTLDELSVKNVGMNGSILQYHFSDPAGFIETINPANGSLQMGQSENIIIVYNAEGYTAGTYTQDITISSNDPDNPLVTVENEMVVTTPSTFAGQVKDCNTTLPLRGVKVSAGEWSGMTNNNGEYSFNVEPGTWDVSFVKPAYKTIVIPGQTALEGQTTTIDTCLVEFPYPPQFVTATVNDDDTECLVEWGLPSGPYEIVYDDGTAENYFVWLQAKSQSAVKFTPAGYPCIVTGGRIHIGKNFPLGSTLVGTDFGAVVYDDNGSGEMPGTQLDSVSVTITEENVATGWVEFYGFNVPLEEGDFYISMVQSGTPPNTAGVGIDEEVPTSYRSYTKQVNSNWMISTFQDFMIRAIVDGPQGTLDNDNVAMIHPPKPVKSMTESFVSLKPPVAYKGGREGKAVYRIVETEDARGVVKYRLIRYAGFDPDDPEDMGVASTLSDNEPDNEYNDVNFGGLPMGWYKYGVSANFINGDWSDTAISNIVGHLMDYPVTFKVSTTDGSSPMGAELVFSGQEFPYEVYTAEVPGDGEVLLESVWRGVYDLDVYLEGFSRYLLQNNYVVQPTEIIVVLEEKTYPPRNLWVDPLTSIAYWNTPLSPPNELSENFEGGVMPPGWSTSSQGNSEWIITEDGSSDFFAIPPHSWYAVCNDDAAGPNNNGCCDYLITPVVDLRDYPDYMLEFQSYYTGEYGQLAFVEYTTDGEDFFVIEQINTANEWTEVNVDLSPISGPGANAYTWLAFHSDDDGQWGTGWAVDDIIINSAAADNGPSDSLSAYQVFIDGAYVATTPDSSYQYEYLNYGQLYTAGVAAQYSSGLSAMITYSFRSEYLIPPRNLSASGFDDYAYIQWDPPVYPAFNSYHVNSQENVEEMDKNTQNSILISPLQNTSAAEDFHIYLPGRDAGPTAWANDVQNNTWYTIDVETYDQNTIAAVSFTGFAGDFPRDFEDKMYVVDYISAGNENLLIVDAETGEINTVGSMVCPISGSGGIWSGLTSNRENGIMYAAATDVNQTVFCTVDLGTASVTQFGSTTTAPGIIDIALNTVSNTMFGWCIATDKAYTIDLTTGDATELGDLGFNANYAQGGGWNPYDQQVYLAAYGTAAELRILDQTTGATQVLTALPGETGAFGFPGAISGPGGDIPENLLGYILYRFDDSITSMEHPTTEYYDFDLLPATYEYSVSALYDLTPYGFAGTAESMLEGPVEVLISFGYPLPFFEGWEYGNFEINEWDHDACSNWRINAQEGMPEPSAEFTWDDPLEFYRCPLLSHPLKGSEIIDGDIYLDFDIKLIDRNGTADEFMNVSVWENNNWHTVKAFNNKGSYDWTHHSIEITDIVKGNDFRVAFVASGDSSVNIEAWFIDNINVYRVCPPPFMVNAEYLWPEEKVEISWIPPYSIIGEWMEYNDGTFENSFASTNGGSGLATLFQVEDFPNVNYPFTVVKLRYFNDDYGAYQQEENVYLLTGDGQEILGGPYVITDATPNDWVEIDIDPVVISSGNIMLATINVLPDGPFVGVDDSDFNETLYFGTIGDWTELSQFGSYYYVGSHEAYVEMEVDGQIVMNSLKSKPPQGNTDVLQLNESVHAGLPNNVVNDRALNGFNIYRKDDAGSDWIRLNDAIIPQSPYIDETITPDHTFHYYVTAVFDQCESDSSENVFVDIYTGVDENRADQVMVYPNPAGELVNIVSGGEFISTIRLTSFSGQLVDEVDIEAIKYSLNISETNEGIYLLEIELEDGIVEIRKLSIIR